MTDGVKPTLAELERFEEQPEGKHLNYLLNIYKIEYYCKNRNILLNLFLYII